MLFRSIGVNLIIKVIDGFENAFGLLSSCPIIEVNQGFAVNGLVKNGEVGSNFINCKLHSIEFSSNALGSCGSVIVLP